MTGMRDESYFSSQGEVNRASIRDAYPIAVYWGKSR